MISRGLAALVLQVIPLLAWYDIDDLSPLEFSLPSEATQPNSQCHTGELVILTVGLLASSRPEIASPLPYRQLRLPGFSNQ